MIRCNNCEEEISAEEHTQFKGLCKLCFRYENYDTLGESCHVCGKTAVADCVTCGKPICTEHHKLVFNKIISIGKYCPKCEKKARKKFGFYLGIMLSASVIPFLAFFVIYFNK